MNAESTSLQVFTSKKVEARAAGYSFAIVDDFWELDKDVKINVGQTADLLSEPTRHGFLSALAYYASSLSSHHTKNILERLHHMLLATGAKAISDTMLINYRASLEPERMWYIGVIRGFLRRWYQIGYPGVNKEIIRLLDGWRIKGNRKGDAVKRKDPREGPLTDNELQAFNEGAIRARERYLITLAELAMCLVTSNTGRRPIQIAQLRAVDLVRGTNAKGESTYFLRMPRAKLGKGFRSSFKPFALTEDLWLLLSEQARSSIRQVEACLGFQLQQADRQEVPLFPDFDVVKSISSLHGYRALLNTDKLHCPSAEVSDTLQYVVGAGDIYSERTGELLQINARRFRYTAGTRAAREGLGVLVIAELLDHSDTQNAGVYIKNIPEHVKRLDEAVGFQLAPLAQAFQGVLVDSEKDAKRGDDPTSRIRSEEGQGIGTCGESGFCNANVPLPCYTCMHFQPWLNGPHAELYEHLLRERERLKEVTGDLQISAILDRTIVAVADVIQRCDQRRQELNQQAVNADG